MGSFNSREEDQGEEELEAAATNIRDLEIYHRQHQHQHQQQPIISSISADRIDLTAPPPAAAAPPPLPNAALHIRQLLIRCADLISHSDSAAAHRLLSVLSANSSPFGDATERLVHHFSRALFHRLNNTTTITSTTYSSILRPDVHDTVEAESDIEAVHSSYLTLNQITPFIRFCHLTANQAILDAIDDGQQALHILDLDIMHGLQWPPFMQALADRPSPPLLRITATGTDLSLLRRTGDRLLRFADSLGLRFQFHPLHHHHDHDLPLLLSSSALVIFPDEALAVNCVLFLHRLLRFSDQQRNLVILSFLNTIKALNPKVVTIAEREANLNSHIPALFMPTFVEALDHYTAIFDSLEATLPPSSRDRLAVEQIWLASEILEVVARGAEDNNSIEDERRRWRAQRYDAWEVMLGRSGFSNVALSPFALSQAKLLLRLHYPSEGYRLRILNNSFFLGWQNRPLFSVSSWH